MQAEGSGGYATVITEDGLAWISLSGSDADAGLGNASANGNRYGDAFDLYRFFEHGNDFTNAVREYGVQIQAAKMPPPNPASLPPGIEPGMTVVGPPPPKPPVKVKHITQAISELKPPDYIIKGLLARSYIYSLTAATGSGKTCLMILLALYVAKGQPLFGRKTKKGRVLYLIGENPDDTLPRFGVASFGHHINLDDVEIHVTTQLFNLDKTKIEIGTDLDKLGPVDLVFVDTGPSFFSHFGAVDGENSNDAMIKFGHALRKISTDVQGNPTIIAAMHPAKGSSSKAAMVPRGGSAFLNEVDGNLCLTSEDGGNTSELHWTGKIRGIDFEPMSFRNVKTSMGGVADVDGEPIVSVYARPMSDDETRQAEQASRSNREKVLEAMLNQDTGIGVTDIAVACGLVNEKGEVKKSSVHDVLKNLTNVGDAETVGGGQYRLTAKGKRTAKALKKAAAGE